MRVVGGMRYRLRIEWVLCWFVGSLEVGCRLWLWLWLGEEVMDGGAWSWWLQFGFGILGPEGEARRGDGLPNSAGSKRRPRRRYFKNNNFLTGLQLFLIQ